MFHFSYTSGALPNRFKYYITMYKLKYQITVIIVILAGTTSGCATTEGAADPSDPFEGYNRAVHGFNKDFDKAVATPVAKAYQYVTPTWVDKGITNFFGNLGDFVVVINDLLQFKFMQAASDTARIAFNTTVGVFGFFDPATQLDFRKHNEDFGQTLGYWGVPAGPYFVLPFLGPSTIRDSAGLAVDYVYLDPIVNYYDDLQTRYLFLAVNYIDKRADLLGATRLVEAAALDEYIFIREAYLQRRLYHVYDGDPPMDEFEETDYIEQSNESTESE